MVTGCAGGRGSGGKFSGLDDGGASLLDGLNEVTLDPFFIADERLDGDLSLNGIEVVVFKEGVVDVRVLGGTVVAPDDNVLNLLIIDVDFLSDLGDGSVMVESSQSSEVFGVDSGGVFRKDQSVGISGVTDDTDLDVLSSELVEVLALILEDLGIGSEEVLSLHALGPGLGPAHNGVVHILEGDGGVG